MPINKQELIKQIGDYTSFHQSKNGSNAEVNDEAFVSKTLTNPQARERLYEGISSSTTSTQYREAFTQFIANLENDENYKLYTIKDPDTRSTNPIEATISLQTFLGTEGLALYKKALQEEYNSKEYRNAVFRASTTHYEGPKLNERLFLYLSGPSACGKSYATSEVVKTVCKSNMVQKTNEKTGNDFIAIDGGIGREVSQMRKLVIQAAIKAGYTGILNLEKHSKALRPIKTDIREATLKNSNLSLVIPDTFSDWTFGIFHKKGDIFTKIDKLPNTKQIFCRIDGADGADPSIFKRTVNFMGSSRAWQTNSGKLEKLDMNNSKNLCESKAYNSEFFGSGVRGSKRAQSWFEKNTKTGNISINIINDLTLEKKNNNTFLVSARIVNKWKIAKETGDKSSLKDYMKTNSVLPIINPPFVVLPKDDLTTSFKKILQNAIPFVSINLTKNDLSMEDPNAFINNKNHQIKSSVGHTYSFSCKNGIPKAMLSSKGIMKVEGETEEAKEMRLAQTMTEILNNVLSHSIGFEKIAIKTAFLNTITNEYIKHLQDEIGLNIDYTPNKSLDESPEALKIFETLKKNITLANLKDAPWYMAAVKLREQDTHSLRQQQ